MDRDARCEVQSPQQSARNMYPGTPSGGNSTRSTRAIDELGSDDPPASQGPIDHLFEAALW